MFCSECEVTFLTRSFFQVDPHKEGMIRNINRIIAIIMFIILIPAINNQLKVNMPLQMMVITDGIVFVVAVILVFSVIKRRFTVFSMYLASVGNALQFLGGTIDTHLYAILFLSVILFSLYQEWKVLTLNVLILSLGFHFKFRENVYFENGTQYYLFYVMFFLAVAGLLAYNVVSEKMRKQFIHKEEELHTSQIELENVYNETAISEQRLDVFNNQLHNNLHLTKNISNEIVHNFSEITKGVESQTVNINTINASLKDIGAVIEQVSDASEVVAEASTQTESIATEYSSEMENVTKEMERVAASIQSTFALVNELNEKNKHISDIVATLNGLASQTNLLSLNASIEAARAGEQGKGFAVVASEVKKLADDSQEASEMISDILHEIQEQTKQVANEAKEGLVVVKTSRDTLLKTQAIFSEVSYNTKNITQHSNENQRVINSLKSSAGLILNEMESIAATSEEVNASIEEILSSVENQNKNIDDILGSFNQL